GRAVVSPIDESLSLWSEGRRERLAELEEEIRQHDAKPRQAPQHQQQREHDRRRPHRHQYHRQQTEMRRGAEQNNNTAAAAAAAAAGAGGGGGGHDRAFPFSSTTQLEERLGRWGAGWRPPALRELPRGGEGFFSGWTHLGQPERFELVKSVNRSVGVSGGPLSDAELEWAVLCLEEAEERMAALDFSTAAGILERVLGRCPGLTLAYYRLALCLLAARGAHASRQAERLLDCAMSLEGAENQHLRIGVDLVLRILRNDSIPKAYWSEDNPRSLGDLRALEAAVDQQLS
ncbi:unnamed protein product, partial [Pylaiella littoralis]